MRVLCFSALVALACVAAVSGARYNQTGSFSVTNPAFFTTATFQYQGSAPTPSLFISSFSGSPFSGGVIYIVENITNSLKDVNGIAPVQLPFSFKWPNAIAPVPADALKQLGLQSGILVPDGFLVPGKSDGGLYIFGNDQSGKVVGPFCVTPEEKGFFYHTAKWVDMNKDGRLDLLSAHANKPLFGSTTTGLVWYEQPADGLATLPWKEHFITEGPDVFFEIADFDNDPSTIDVIATEFFSDQISLNFLDLDQGGNLTFRREFETNIGPAYFVQQAKLSGDNNTHLLVTNHQADASKSGVFVYDVPPDVFTGVFDRHEVATDFAVSEGGFNQAAPGFAYAVYPRTTQDQGELPLILVAGDGSQSAYLLTPTGPYEYNQEVIIKTGGTVGSIYVSDDWDGDSYREFLVPDYDENKVYFYSFTA